MVNIGKNCLASFFLGQKEIKNVLQRWVFRVWLGIK